MPDLNTLYIFLLATLALNLTPGPDMLYVIVRSIGQGRMAGVASSLGIGVGCIVHTVAVALGLSALLRSVPFAFDVVKYVGAAYLCYLGIRTLVSKSHLSIEAQPGGKRDNLAAIFFQGVVTNVLNPKVALFFLAFLPQFVSEARGPVMLQVITLGLLFVTSGTLVNVAVALLASRMGDSLARRPAFLRVQKWFTGSVFILLAARIAFTERDS
ncbi:MAG TPA: LysE family translocator [Chloroflexia bacterium]|nr:LysE family translocator [Chloroflexia bacterium]